MFSNKIFSSVIRFKKFMRKIINLVITFLCFYWISLEPFSIVVTNGILDIQESKKICVRLLLENDEKFIYKDTIRFSIDVPDIALTYWTPSIHSTHKYIPSFRRGQKIYTESFSGELTIDFVTKDIVGQKKSLEMASIYVAAVVGKDRDISSPVNSFASLNSGVKKLSFSSSFTGVSQMFFSDSLSSTLTDTLQSNLGLTLSNTLSDTISIALSLTGTWAKKILLAPCVLTRTIISSSKIEDLSNRFLILWRTLMHKLREQAESFWWLKWYLILTVFLILLIIKIFYRPVIYIIPLWGRLEIETRYFILLIWGTGTLLWLRFIIPEYLIFFVLGFYFIPFAFYYIRAPQDKFSGRLKSLIGFILACFVLPLWVKGYLLKNLDLILFWLK